MCKTLYLYIIRDGKVNFWVIKEVWKWNGPLNLIYDSIAHNISQRSYLISL